MNGLRFFAVSMVILEHVEWIKKQSGFANLDHIPFIDQAGDNGVTLFFVLSGFLITYLLLQEIKTTDTVRVKYFYIRRMLRIWPLYYLVTLLSFFVLPYLIHLPGYPPLNESPYFSWQLACFIFFLPNIARIFTFPVAFADPLWSVGVEEQFYFVWPHILKHCRKRLLLIFSLIIIGIIVLRKAVFMYRDMANLNEESSAHRLLEALAVFLQSFTIECMAIGGIAALLLMHKKQRVLNIIYNRVFQSAMYILLFFSMSYDHTSHEALGHIINSFFFACIILNVSSNPNSILKLENGLFRYLGKISYGIYIYHNIFIGIAFALLTKISGHAILWNVLMYLAVFALTIACAGISYRVFEKKFLDRKEKFTIVKNDAQ